MMQRLANPSLRWVGGLFAVAAAFLIGGAWMINSGNANVAAYSFPPLLIGMILLFMVLAQLALWALNRAQGPTPPPD